MEPQQQRVQRGDLRPVGVLRARGLRVQRGDGGLERVEAGAAAAQRLLGQGLAFRDLGAVPARAVLVLQGDDLARASSPVTSGAPGISSRRSRARRMASLQSSRRTSASPEVAA